MTNWNWILVSVFAGFSLGFTKKTTGILGNNWVSEPYSRQKSNIYNECLQIEQVISLVTWSFISKFLIQSYNSNIEKIKHAYKTAETTVTLSYMFLLDILRFISGRTWCSYNGVLLPVNNKHHIVQETDT